MQWISFALTVMGMILKYGPQLWGLGKDIYNEVEKLVARTKREDSVSTPEARKAMADATFDEMLKDKTTALVNLGAMKAVPAPVTRVQLRRDVWATRPENVKKVILGRKPT